MSGKAEQGARRVERAEIAKRGPPPPDDNPNKMFKVLLRRLEHIEKRKKQAARRDAIEAAERWEAFVLAGGFPGLGKRH